MKVILYIAAVLTGLATSASAVTINETTDFSDSLAGAGNVGTLDLGSNFVSGTMTGSCDFFNDFCFGGPDRQDSIRVSVSAGTQLTEITVTTEGNGPLNFSYSASVSTEGFAQLENEIALINSSATLDTFGPLGEGTYIFNINAHLADDTGPFDMFWGAEFTVEPAMAPVPLPASALLLLGGVGALGALRRRKVRS